MTNVLQRTYRRYEQEVESDRYSTTQRLLATAALLGVMAGGVKAIEHFEIDETVMDGVASVFGQEGSIDHQG